MWNKLGIGLKLNILAAESSVLIDFLIECKPLMAALKWGESKEKCLQIINENF
jgi:hypothetical protein